MVKKVNEVDWFEGGSQWRYDSYIGSTIEVAGNRLIANSTIIPRYNI